MSESYDVELSRALKESAAKELGGWEFTPAMRAKVLQQIRAEESGQPAPAAPAPRRFAPAPILRPLAWVAVAAAAFAVVLNIGIPGVSEKQTAQAPSSAPSEGVASAPAAPRLTDHPAGIDPAQMKNAPPTGGEAGSAPGQQGGQFETTAITSVAVADQVVLALPDDAVAMLAVPPGDAPTISAPAPDQGQTFMTMTAVLPRNVALESGSQLVSLTLGGVQRLNEDGVTVAWEQPLENLTETSAVALAPDGRVAVAGSAAELTVLTASGEHQRTLTASAAAGSLLWSPDGRLAAAEGELVCVYSTTTGKREFSVAAGTPADMAFLADGSFATFGGQVGDPATLVIVDQKGNLRAERKSETGGRGLAVTVEGSIIVAGGQAYDMAGNPLWKLSIVPMGVASAGRDRVVAWDAQTVVLVNGHDGSPVLEAVWNGGGQGVRQVVASADGRYLAVLALTEQGPVVWVLDGAGAQVYVEKLGETPVDLAFSGNRLLIMLEQSLIVHDLPQ